MASPPMIQTTRVQLYSGIYVVIGIDGEEWQPKGPQNNGLSHRPPSRFDVTILVEVGRPTDMALADGDARGNDRKTGASGLSEFRLLQISLVFYGDNVSGSNNTSRWTILTWVVSLAVDAPLALVRSDYWSTVLVY
ncbi:hypothetical protein N7519_004552 [Penicillium mononematosum]|uniref:uncharacterized protein n=1 Tax=Penicillium mononematosum TaxID=268346 RepID=UPI002548CA9E|nr:uncharacterized protein N7519_004552 [Penicillium mononematosum]KAJ6189644.1 hypothetical protein N7519_004552 [Penicillium mononematosum]